MNNLLYFLKNNESVLVLIVSIITVFINIYVTSTSNYQKKKEISIKNLDFIMEHFLNELYLTKNKYLKENKKIFTKERIHFFINKSHLIEYHLRILLTDIYIIETSDLNLEIKENETLKDKYIKSKENFFEILKTKYVDNIAILENEISLKNMFWQFPISLRIILFTSIISLILGAIDVFIKDIFLFKIFSFFLFFISLFLLMPFLVFNLKDSKSIPRDSSKYTSNEYVKKDKKLSCTTCNISFNVYNGTKIQCPNNIKHKRFKVEIKDLNLLDNI